MDDKTVNIDTFEINAPEVDSNQPYTFERFKAENTDYLDKLKKHIRNAYNAYHLLHVNGYSKLKAIPEYYELASKLGFGMLMRHALETISTSVALENGIEVGARSVHDRLTALKGQNIPGFDREKRDVLFDLLDLTNEIAHPHILHKYNHSFNDLKSFYETSFKSVLQSHISYIEGLIKRIGTVDFGVSKAVKTGRKQALNYLKKLKRLLDNFSLNNRTTSILAQGCLVRQLTECATNNWCYNYNVVPTDASTFENQIHLSGVLLTLRHYSETGKRNGFGRSALSREIVDGLVGLKNTSNNLMHIERFSSENLSELGKELSKLHPIVKHLCSPGSLFDPTAEPEVPWWEAVAEKMKKVFRLPRGKSPSVVAVLCGAFGWTGIHHFYMNNKFKGFMYLLFGGFLIGPALDLYRLLRGIFKNNNTGVPLKNTKLSTVLAVAFLIIHLFVIHSAVTSFDAEKLVSRIKEINITKAFSVEKIDESAMEGLSRISVSDCTSTSCLETSNDRFSPLKLIDGSGSTCWQEGTEGNGEGESITFILPEKRNISVISILNGKHTSSKAYSENSRAERIVVKVGNKRYTITLDDVMEKQIFRLPSPKEAEEITVIINSAYPGDKWEDLCISEITFYEPSAA